MNKNEMPESVRSRVDASYGVVPPLALPLSVEAMTTIAAEEAALEFLFSKPVPAAATAGRRSGPLPAPRSSLPVY